MLTTAPPCLVPTDVQSVSFMLSISVETIICEIFSQTKQITVFHFLPYFFSFKEKPSVSFPFRSEIRQKTVERVAKEQLFSFGRSSDR
jgi:hypothetical protein